MEAFIVQSVLWMETTFEIWQDLHEGYYQGDIFRISELFGEIHTYKQGNMSIGSYFTHIKGLWQEFDNFRPIPTCSCLNKCECGLVTIIRSYREYYDYDVVRSQIMLMDPLSSVNKTFSLLIQQEKHLNMHVVEPTILANSSNYGYFAHNPEYNTIATSSRGKTRGRSYTKGGNMLERLGGGRGTRVCSFCHKTGHTVDHCYRKHGFPPGSQRHNTVNNCTVTRKTNDDGILGNKPMNEVVPMENQSSNTRVCCPSFNSRSICLKDTTLIN
ncbi:hypothetical protein Lal_00032216 [Lupinus albus]|nr:hypothetical protein Lal_00032216 [Lupinus albus]